MTSGTGRAPPAGWPTTSTATTATEYFGAHLDSFGADGRVTAGTVVGYVGNTGDASGGAPHLHFEIHPGGSGYITRTPR